MLAEHYLLDISSVCLDEVLMFTGQSGQLKHARMHTTVIIKCILKLFLDIT